MPSRAIRREQEREQARRAKMIDARKKRLRERRAKTRAQLQFERPQLTKLGWQFWSFLAPAIILGVVAVVMYLSHSAVLRPYAGQLLNGGIAFLLIYMGATRRNNVPKWWGMVTIILGAVGLVVALWGVLVLAGIVPK